MLLSVFYRKKQIVKVGVGGRGGQYVKDGTQECSGERLKAFCRRFR
jgi:hypothetical protein